MLSLKRVEKQTFKALNFLLDQAHAGVKLSQKALREINLYFKSDAYEEDLDEAIRLLHLHNESAKPEFDDIKNRGERVKRKTKFVKEQVTLFVKFSAALGAEIGAKLSGGKGAAEGLVIGTATGVVVVTIVAGHIVLKRVAKGNDGSISVEHVPVHTFIR